MFINRLINLTEKWFTPFVLLWCLCSLLLGLFILNDFILAIEASLICLLMYFVGSGVFGSLINLQVQDSNPSNFIKYVTLIFWGVGIGAFILFLTFGLFTTIEENSTRYSLLVSSVFPLGISKGAAKRWKNFNN